MRINDLIKRYDCFNLFRVDESSLSEFTCFVINIYYKHHLGTAAPEEEINGCIKDDKAVFPYAHFYALRTMDSQIIGTINVCRWNDKLTLGIENEYGISVKNIIHELPKEPEDIWHIGRFAINYELIRSRQELYPNRQLFFKILLCCAFSHICEHADNVMFAECDEKLHQVVKFLGIHSQIIGEGKMLLGSKAFPILNTGDGLLNFYNTYKYLIE